VLKIGYGHSIAGLGFHGGYVMMSTVTQKSQKKVKHILLIFVGALSASTSWAAELESWKSGPTKDRIIQYVEAATKKGGPQYIPPVDRIAVLDNDGTLWSEKPLPVELSFTLDQVRRKAPQHPEWKKQQPFKAVLEKDREYFTSLSEDQKIKQVLKLIAATHSQIPVRTFKNDVKQWFATSKDAKLQAFYTKRAYTPMLELLDYLREKEFKTYIVTGGDTDFVRAISQRTYGIPAEQVIGSQFQTRLEKKGGDLALIRGSKIVEPANNASGKPVNIQHIIGKVPVIAVGNSDGDLEMLQYAGTSDYPSLQVLIHHDDSAREADYDKGAEKILAEAKKRNWVTVSMKNDFSRVYELTPKQLAGEAAMTQESPNTPFSGP
jgi:phosphoserine phosphatase